MVPLSLDNKLSTMTQLLQNESTDLKVKERQPLPVIAIKPKKQAKVILSKKVVSDVLKNMNSDILEEASESLIEENK